MIYHMPSSSKIAALRGPSLAIVLEGGAHVSFADMVGPSFIFDKFENSPTQHGPMVKFSRF